MNARLLVVDDEPISLDMLLENLREEGYEADGAEDGESAWQALVEGGVRYDAILLDRLMPDMDGIEILRRIKTQPELAATPVIMQTSMSEPADIAEGLREGAFYYLTKPFEAETMLAIVAAAIEDARRHRELRAEVEQAARTAHCLTTAEFRFRTPGEARDIATLLANTADDPGRIVLGLSELLLNAVEHGNLAITYAEKSALIADNALMQEVQRRLEDPLLGRREAIIRFEREDDSLRFVISDEGSGFDWHQYLEISPERAFDTHGRGIAMARMISFQNIEYRGCGNEVLAVASRSPLSS